MRLAFPLYFGTSWTPPTPIPSLALAHIFISEVAAAAGGSATVASGIAPMAEASPTDHSPQALFVLAPQHSPAAAVKR